MFTFKKISGLVAAAIFAASLASASITYTCDPSINATQAGTCAYLNSTVAGYYSSTFSNANANIYILMGTTGLGESSSGAPNLVSYSSYLSALNTTASTDSVDTGAIASLAASEPALYGGGEVDLTSALCTAIGISGCKGTTPSGNSCILGTSNCYNGVIVVTTPANLSAETGGSQFLYWDQTGGTQPGDAYDFYSIVQHETDEILGTASCIEAGTLTDDCHGSNVSAVDLFRYQSSGNLVFESTTPGAYFSYNGGVTNGAAGAVYNTVAGNDYADFTSNCAHVQDESGCLGQTLNITNDGNAEINILDAVGYNLVPEPGTWFLLGAGMVGLIALKRRG